MFDEAPAVNIDDETLTMGSSEQVEAYDKLSERIDYASTDCMLHAAQLYHLSNLAALPVPVYYSVHVRRLTRLGVEVIAAHCVHLDIRTAGGFEELLVDKVAVVAHCVSRTVET